MKLLSLVSLCAILVSGCVTGSQSQQKCCQKAGTKECCSTGKTGTKANCATCPATKPQ